MMFLPASPLAIGSVLGFLSVALGAFGAHALKEKFDAYSMSVFQTAVQYQTTHALVLVALGALFIAKPDLIDLRGAHASILCFTLGTIIFSGTLYALAFTGIKVLGAITPIGGVLLLIGWISCLLFALHLRNQA